MKDDFLLLVTVAHKDLRTLSLLIFKVAEQGQSTTHHLRLGHVLAGCQPGHGRVQLVAEVDGHLRHDSSDQPPILLQEHGPGKAQTCGSSRWEAGDLRLLCLTRRRISVESGGPAGILRGWQSSRPSWTGCPSRAYCVGGLRRPVGGL